ncbi:selenocysteine-specific translation elongation factor [uncultured Anaerotruncus sp.]|uniref:selenocysteine-specific translation elongation factor n=1 Tax=uncultured Anaerotruncus sp. TaxID=905011 RepID=UPI00280A92E9|nr:selenocysteine-specific translation elongation factor [uncultured Anaerotruncus sp.]
MKRIVIGTAGHVDHGKTALVRALTGIDPDRLAEEKRRGLTVDLGFAWMDLPGEVHADVVDVPGHEHFVKNMLAGAGGIDLALLAVAADEGVMPQTREHAAILSLLGVPRGVIVLTRCDLADGETRSLAREEAAEAVRGTFLEGAPVVETSAETGEGLGELRVLLAEEAEKLPARNSDRPFFLPVDRAFTVRGFGAVVTGTVLDGQVRPGDLLTVSPGGTSVRVRGLQSCGREVAAAFAGQRVAVNLAGTETGSIVRGDALTAAPSARAQALLDVRLAAHPASGRVISHNQRLHLALGTACVLCRARLLDREALSPGESGYAQLVLEQPVAVRPGDRFVVRFYSPVETVGGGVVLDIPARRHRRLDSAVLARLQCYDGADARGRLRFDLAAAPAAREQARERLFYLSDAEFSAAWEGLLSDGEILPAGRLASTPGTLARLRTELLDTLADYHEAHPLDRGMPLALLREGFPGGLPEWFAEEGCVSRVGDAVALPGFTPEGTDLYRRVAEELLARYAREPYAPPDRAAALAEFPPSVPAGRVLDLLLEAGKLVEAAPGLCFTRTAWKNARSAARRLAGEEGGVTLSGLRDALGTSRRYAQALLERMDADGFTRREGDAHLLLEERP